jgi:hypothetical protein
MTAEYMSCWSIAMGSDLESAKQMAHDNVIQGAGADRLSGVLWTLPDDVARLCALYPGHTLVMATVAVKPGE